MNPLVDPEDLDEATQVINRYSQSDWVDISYSRHARERLQERIIPNDVLVMTLQTGRVVGVRSEMLPNARLRFSYEVEMVDRYGRVTVITAIPGRCKLHIVSVYTDIPD